MAISDETMWTAVVCGLIAHADGVLDGEECELLSTIIEDEADGGEYADWLNNLGDKDALEQLFERLPAPAAGRHRDLLERAWMMAMVDGERTDSELHVLRDIAQRIGVEGVQLDFWLEAWAIAEEEFSEVAVATLAAIFQGQMTQKVRGEIEQVVARLPVSEARRETLEPSAWAAGSPVEAAARINALVRPKRLQLLRLLASVVVVAEDSSARERFVTLAEEVGVKRERAEALLTS